MTKVAVIGLWHQGIVGAACLADLGHNVTAWDPNKATVERLKTGHAPVFEPGLDDLIGKGIAAGNLHFVDELSSAVSAAEIVCLMQDTPVDDQDRSDLSGIFQTTRDIAPHLAENAIAYVTAQVPIGTCAQLSAILNEGSGYRVPIAYTPENLRLGVAVERFRHPDLPVIGTQDASAFERLEALFAPLNVTWRQTGLESAEMLKHALNGFLAVSICFANELGNLCDRLGANGVEVAKLLRMEPRVGSKAMLMPGLGFSGGTLARDMMTLRILGDRVGVNTPMLDGAWVSNQEQNKLVTERLTHLLSGLVGKRICVLGLTYKPDTSTLRRSAALELVHELTSAGASVTATDPAADPTEVTPPPNFEFKRDIYEAAADADALVLMTPWNVYREVDFQMLRGVMHGAIIFDTARLWQADAVSAHGFRYFDIGSGRVPTT